MYNISVPSSNGPEFCHKEIWFGLNATVCMVIEKRFNGNWMLNGLHIDRVSVHIAAATRYCDVTVKSRNSLNNGCGNR